MSIRKPLGGKSLERDAARLRTLIGPGTGASGGVPTTRTLTAGAGLTGGGDLGSDRTFDMGTPGGLSVSSVNGTSPDSHTHAIASSSNPGAAASLLASSASGYLQLTRLGVGTAPGVPLHIAAAAEQARLEYNAGNYTSLTVDSGGGLTLATTTSGAGGNLALNPAGDVTFDPGGNDVHPLSNYDLNLGLINKKWLTLHAAELWVETLVAQETIATIGGRVLVGPTNVFVNDFGSGTVSTGTPPAYVAEAHGTNASGTTHTYNKPAGTAENDVLVAHIVTTGATVSAAGWTEIVSTNHGTASLRSTVLYKVAGASEPASYDFTVASAQIGAGGIVTLRNVDTSSVVDAFGGTTSGLDATIEAPSITTTVNNALVLFLGATAGEDGWTVTPPDGITEAFDQFHASDGASAEAAYVLQTAPGASGAKTATIWKTGGSGDSEPGYATPALVQAKITASSGPELAASFDAPVTAGNLVVVALTTLHSTSGDSAISDNQRNVYHRIGTTLQSGNCRLELWYAYNATGGATTVTVDPVGSTGDITVALHEYSGIETSSDPYDKTAGTTGTSTAPSSGDTATTSQAAELVIGALTHNNGGSPTIAVGSGFTQATEAEESDAGMPEATEYKVVTATGAYAATWTTGSSVDWLARVATFKARLVSGSPAPYPQSDRVTAAVFAEGDVARYADNTAPNGSDLWPLTWADDDEVYTTFGDGYGFDGSVYDLFGISRISGTPPATLTGTDLFADTGKCNAGIVCVGGVIYAYVEEQGAWTRCKLWSSSNHGSSWTDNGWIFDEGATNDYLFEEFAVINYGKNYAGAKDDYVYGYGRKSNVEPDSLYLARCPKAGLTTRANYEFRTATGWSSDIAEAEPVFTLAGLEWGFSGFFHPATDRYWLVARHNDTAGWGIYDSPTPYGPWTTVFYKESGWIDAVRKITFHFCQKWMNAGGTELYMAFSGVDDYDSLNIVKMTLTLASPLPANACSIGQLVALKSVMDLPLVTVKYNNFTAGDIVYCEAGGKIEFMRVESNYGGSAGAYTYKVTRNLDGTGANDWYAGDALFDTGRIGNGFIDLYSIRGVKSATQYGPTIAGNVRTGTGYNDWSEHWALGNLNGLYGYGADAYGFAAGKYSLTTPWIAADAVNGFRVMHGNTCLGQWDTSGDFILGQVATDKANVFWDQSAGRLNFRGGAGGTQTRLYIDKDGRLFAGNRSIWLDDSGVTLLAGSYSSQDNYVKWRTAGGALSNYLAPLYTAWYNELAIRSNALSTSQPGFIRLQAASNYGIGYTPELVLEGRGDGAAPNTYGHVRINLPEEAQAFYITADALGVTPGSFASYVHKFDTLGNAWFAGNCSALTFTDRTPHLDLETARAAVRSVRGQGGQLDHDNLHPAIRGAGGRDLSATVSALMEVVRDIDERIGRLER